MSEVKQTDISSRSDEAVSGYVYAFDISYRTRGKEGENSR